MIGVYALVYLIGKVDRLAQGTEALYEHAFKGLRAMPARGACVDCSDAELKAAVDYLVEHGK